MSFRELAFAIEELSYDAREIDSYQEVFFEAIFHGEPTPDGYEWAFHAFGKTTATLAQKIAELRELLFERLPNEAPVEEAFSN